MSRNLFAVLITLAATAFQLAGCGSGGDGTGQNVWLNTGSIYYRE